MKTITHPTVKAADKDNIVPNDLFEQFRSLRGAVAYTLLTRTDIAVYVVYLQRQLETTTNYRHIHMLNLVVKRLQSTPQVLKYECLGPSTKFLVITDSAFKKEEQTGHSLKGTLLLRVPDTNCDFATGTHNCHLLDFNSKRISNVTRSTFSAELFGLCDACDHAMFLRQIVHEFIYGPLSAYDGVQLREGRLQTTVHIEVAIDAMSVFAAVTAQNVKAPAEKSLLSHVQFVRELLDKGIIRALIWLDTRDMQMV